MESGLYSRRFESNCAFWAANESKSQMTMGASGACSASAISEASSFAGLCTSTVLFTEERTSRMNEDVAVSFVKKSMEGIIVVGGWWLVVRIYELRIKN